MEDFVTFEIAKKLKEKGFKELCLAYYTNDDILYYNYSHKSGSCYKDCYLSHNLMPKGSISGKFVDAPTIAQSLKWLRKEKSLYIVPCVIEYYDTDADGNIINKFVFWSFDIALTENGDIIYSENERIDDRRFNSYEDAALAGIDYVLDNLI